MRPLYRFEYPSGGFSLETTNIDEGTVVSRTMVDVAKLPPDWRDSPAPPALQVLGDAWLAAGATALLALPSAIAPLQLNFVLNPAHPDARRCITGASQAWRFDPRLKVKR